MMGWLSRFFRPEATEYEDAVIAALVAVAEKGEIVNSDLSRSGISEMEFSYEGNRVRISWYARGELRDVNFNGLDSPASMHGGKRVLRVALARAELEFRKRASLIINSVHP